MERRDQRCCRFENHPFGCGNLHRGKNENLKRFITQERDEITGSRAVGCQADF